MTILGLVLGHHLADRGDGSNGVVGDGWAGRGETRALLHVPVLGLEPGHVHVVCLGDVPLLWEVGGAGERDPRPSLAARPQLEQSRQPVLPFNGDAELHLPHMRAAGYPVPVDVAWRRDSLAACLSEVAAAAPLGHHVSPIPVAAGEIVHVRMSVSWMLESDIGDVAGLTFGAGMTPKCRARDGEASECVHLCPCG